MSGRRAGAAGDRALAEYRARRDPQRTPEPFGGPRPPGGRLFVIQKHAARRLHYDLRLEIEGTLKSWAVPRGPSVRPCERRLAVHVEDHPVEYADFEGVIPAGNYGAGPVIVWDRGWYRPVKPEPLPEQLRRGLLEVEFVGVKLRGRWTLARMGRSERDWLLLKKADAHAGGQELTERFPQSVLSGLTIEELRDGPGRLAELRARLDALGAPARDVPAGARGPMLATLVERPPGGPGWLFEIKYDGVRVLAARQGREVRLAGRAGQDFTARYPEVVLALRALPLDRFLIDGELVALDEAGRPSFQRLQLRMHLTRPADIEQARTTVPVTGIFFDALALDGRDLRDLPLVERKACLALVLPGQGLIRYGDHVAGHGRAFWESACEQRLEGVVAKQAASRYAAGRSRDWLKIKCQLRQEFVIGGYTDPQGSRGWFGALHLGLWEDGRLVHVCKVGTGFDERTLRRVWDRLRPLARPTSPFAAGTPKGRGHHWVEPRLVAEVRFTEWTGDGGLRHPAFLGLRDDKRPEECVRERPLALPAGADRPAAPEAPAPASRRTGARAAPAAASADHRVRVTNPTKVFWPDEGLTKGDLVAYYETIAPRLLPYLADRPLVLTRYPDGIRGKSFFQKDAPEFAPDWLRTVRIHSRETRRDIDYLVVDDVEGLRWVANLGTIPIHLWASRTGSLEQPDWLVLDLDPKGAPFAHVVRVARAVKMRLDRLALPGFVKTSGATGLHVLVPLGPGLTYEQARTFARLLATLVVEAEPEIATVARPLGARGGKVYVDWGQNGHGQTIVAPFAVRPLPGAPVSCPLTWDEVGPDLDPARFTIRTVPERFHRRADPLAPVLAGGIDLAAAVARVEREFGRAPAAAAPARPVRRPAAPRGGGRRPGRSRTPRA